jgi:hypothetical protein
MRIRHRPIATATAPQIDIKRPPGVIRNTAAHGNSSTDVAALSLLYAATVGARWKIRNNWLVVNATTSVCNWFGVGCDSHSRVSALRLPANGLSGTLPPQLAELEALEEINLSGNADLQGSLEPGFSRWTTLVALDFSFTKLAGAICGAFQRLDSDLCALLLRLLLR